MTDRQRYIFIIGTHLRKHIERHAEMNDLTVEDIITSPQRIERVGVWIGDLVDNRTDAQNAIIEAQGWVTFARAVCRVAEDQLGVRRDYIARRAIR